jgi:hypothetical protein
MEGACFNNLVSRHVYLTKYKEKLPYDISIAGSHCRSQRPLGLRHELSSPARTLGSWVRIALEALLSVCFYSVFVLSCVQVAALRRADFLFKESYRLCKRSRNCQAAKTQQRAVEL